jgi:RimJ/RimL family protein N-acetyltransferase
MSSADAALGEKLPAGVLAQTRRLPLKPEAFVLRGRFVEITGFDVDRDLPDVSAALSGAPYAGFPAYDAPALIWRYLRSAGDCSTLDGIQAGLTRVRDMHDARLFVVRLLPDVVPHGGMAIGVLAFMANRPADLSIEIGSVAYTPAYQATPVNTEATALLLRRAFEMGYRRVEWKCNFLNERSKAAALRIGFTFEGVFRQHMIVSGGYSRDTAWFSMLDSEWPARRATLDSWLASEAPVALFRRRAEAVRKLEAGVAAGSPDAQSAAPKASTDEAGAGSPSSPAVGVGAAAVPTPK